MSQIADASTPGARRRLLVTAPFPPRVDATVGGSRVLAELVAALSTRHDVALLYLRASGEPPIDDALARRCSAVEEVARGGSAILYSPPSLFRPAARHPDVGGVSGGRRVCLAPPTAGESVEAGRHTFRVPREGTVRERAARSLGRPCAHRIRARCARSTRTHGGASERNRNVGLARAARLGAVRAQCPGQRQHHSRVQNKLGRKAGEPVAPAF
jgi:hypothetical protein